MSYKKVCYERVHIESDEMLINDKILRLITFHPEVISLREV